MKLVLFASGLAGLLLVAGCQKPDVVECGPVPVPVATSSSSLTGFGQRNGAAVQPFTITLGAGTQTVATSGGAVLNLPGTGFVRPDGTAATGQAQVLVREIYTVPEMVLADRPTTQAGRFGSMLVSGGEFNIRVYSGTQRLRLTTGSLTLRSPIPAGQDTTRQLVWYQTVVPAASAGVDTTGWLRANAAAVQQQQSRYQAFIPLDSIGWWNIDQYWHLYQGAPTAAVQIMTPANTLTETRVYLRPVDFNGLARLYPTNSGGTSWTKAMPVGSTHLAVVLQQLNGQLYYGTQRFTVQAGGSTLTPALQPLSEAEVVRLVRQL